MRPTTIVAWVGLGLLAAGCVPKPKQDYTLEQIPQIPTLKELMHFQAHTVDPWFGKRKQKSFSAEEHEALVGVGQKLVATAALLRDKFAQQKAPSFATYAGQMHGESGKLVTAAQAKNASGVSDALEGVRKACAACHTEYK
ncbi:MAG: cytochrome c [Deltaproteobacteria bacterium]|nr:cytochrome c [Deltaproteobacteria bacterium]